MLERGDSSHESNCLCFEITSCCFLRCKTTQLLVTKLVFSVSFITASASCLPSALPLPGPSLLVCLLCLIPRVTCCDTFLQPVRRTTPHSARLFPLCCRQPQRRPHKTLHLSPVMINGFADCRSWPSPDLHILLLEFTHSQSQTKGEGENVRMFLTHGLIDRPIFKTFRKKTQISQYHVDRSAGSYRPYGQ